MGRMSVPVVMLGLRSVIGPHFPHRRPVGVLPNPRRGALHRARPLTWQEVGQVSCSTCGRTAEQVAAAARPRCLEGAVEAARGDLGLGDNGVTFSA
jgi:hypothetical protein